MYYQEDKDYYSLPKNSVPWEEPSNLTGDK